MCNGISEVPAHSGSFRCVSASSWNGHKRRSAVFMLDSDRFASLRRHALTEESLFPLRAVHAALHLETVVSCHLRRCKLSILHLCPDSPRTRFHQLMSGTCFPHCLAAELGVPWRFPADLCTWTCDLARTRC